MARNMRSGIWANLFLLMAAHINNPEEKTITNNCVSGRNLSVAFPESKETLKDMAIVTDNPKSATAIASMDDNDFSDNASYIIRPINIIPIYVNVIYK